MEEENQLSVAVEVTIQGGKFFYDVLAKKGMSLDEITSVLCGGLALSIRGKQTPELQGEALRAVISYLESEFVNTESFADAYIKK